MNSLHTERILFLDIDGPLTHCLASICGFTHDPVAVKALMLLQEEYGFKVVLCSAQRKLCKVRDDIENHLKLVGLVFHDDWKTPHYSDTYDTPELWKHLPGVSEYDTDKVTKYDRGFEILDWLNRNESTVLDYRILDDSSDTFPLEKSKLIHVKEGELRGGIQLEHYDQLVEWLKNPPETKEQ